MIQIIFIISLSLLTGCATWGQREATMTTSTGQVYVARLPKEGKMEFKDGQVTMNVNLQGTPGPIDSLVQLLTLKYATEVK